MTEQQSDDRPVGKVLRSLGAYAGRPRNAGPVGALNANPIAMNMRCQAHASLKVTDL